MTSEAQTCAIGIITNPYYNPWVISPHNYELFMQNKPNFLDAQMNATFVYTRDYEEKRPSSRPKNKANSKPDKPNWLDAQNERNLLFNKAL